MWFVGKKTPGDVTKGVRLDLSVRSFERQGVLDTLLRLNITRSVASDCKKGKQSLGLPYEGFSCHVVAQICTYEVLTRCCVLKNMLWLILMFEYIVPTLVSM